MNKYDVLIIGSGISGLAAAISASEQGQSVCLLSKEENEAETNTYYAQGGIVSRSEDDSPELLAKDIISAGSYLNSIKAVNYLAEKGPGYVQEYLIDKCKIDFDKTPDGAYDVTREGAHSVRRILHSKDKTGIAIQTGMLEYVKTLENVCLKKASAAIDLITNIHHSTDAQQRYTKTRVVGAYVLNDIDGTVSPVFAKATVLATGGLGAIYLNSSNPENATGDGLAMAYRAGAEIINSEFIQFHPTVLHHRDIKRFLITEALRGEGARLMNKSGEYFMERYNPDLKDLAPRDEVSRAIYREMENSGAGYVLLDATGVKLDLKDRFPLIFETCASVGIDIRKEAIPVVPAAHYFCGGIKVDLDGRTNLDSLYAIGENACTGVHGANRLASVSLLEGLVFGIEVGKAVTHEDSLDESLLNTIPEWVYPNNEREIDPILIKQDMQFIQGTMWNYAGIVRTKRRLLRAKADIEYIGHRIERFYQSARLTPKILSLRNAALTSTLIIRAALHNSESIGCHYRKN